VRASEAIDLHEFMPDEADERPSTPTSPAVDIPQSTRYPGDANVRSLDAIAARLTTGGIPDVIVEMTGAALQRSTPARRVSKKVGASDTPSPLVRVGLNRIGRPERPRVLPHR